MRFLAGMFVVVFASQAIGSEISHERGDVLYSGACTTGYAFVYFDGRRLRRLCISDQAAAKVRDFIDESNTSDCQGEVVVIRGTVKENTLYAEEIDAALGCGNIN